MHLPQFFKPNGAKIIYFLFLLVVAPFPYLIFSEASSQYEVNWIWGFPPLVSWIYDYLPSSLQEININILEISKVKTIYLFIPSYAFFIFLLSCVIGLILEKIKARYGITTFRGLLYRKIEMREIKPKDIIQHSKRIKEMPKKEVKKEEVKPEEKPKEEPKKEELKPKEKIKREEIEEKEEVKLEEIEELDEEKIKEMSTLIREEEGFLKEQKEKLQKYLDEMNVKRLKSIGADVKENKILCSGCKRWIKLPKGKLTKLIEKHGFDVIWEYKCPECKGKK